MNIIELVNVSYSYPGQPALKNTSIGFEEKKISAIIGKSGSGKSTLLQLLNGLIRPHTGSVHVFGKPFDYQNIQSLRLRMGYMVQGTGLFPHLTIHENIAIAGRISKGTAIPKRVDELMELVGLSGSYEHKFPYELSGGEQQRVGLCRALYLNPPILLMDEPLGALDPVTRYEIQQQLLRLQDLSPRTILFVTHDMREAKKLAENMLVLDGGAVQQYDTTEIVLKNPATAAVTKLIESSIL